MLDKWFPLKRWSGTGRCNSNEHVTCQQWTAVNLNENLNQNLNQPNPRRTHPKILREAEQIGFGFNTNMWVVRSGVHTGSGRELQAWAYCRHDAHLRPGRSWKLHCVGLSALHFSQTVMQRWHKHWMRRTNRCEWTTCVRSMRNVQVVPTLIYCQSPY